MQYTTYFLDQWVNLTFNLSRFVRSLLANESIKSISRDILPVADRFYSFLKVHPSQKYIRFGLNGMLLSTGAIATLISTRSLYRVLFNKVIVLSSGQGFHRSTESRIITKAQGDYVESCFRSLISLCRVGRDAAILSFSVGLGVSLYDYNFNYDVYQPRSLFSLLLQGGLRLTRAVTSLRWLHPDVLYVYGSAFSSYQIWKFFLASKGGQQIKITNIVNNYAGSALDMKKKEEHIYSFAAVFATLDEYSGLRMRLKHFIQMLEHIPRFGFYPTIKRWWTRPLPIKDRVTWFDVLTWPIRLPLVALVGSKYKELPDLIPPMEFEVGEPLVPTRPPPEKREGPVSPSTSAPSPSTTGVLTDISTSSSTTGSPPTEVPARDMPMSAMAAEIGELMSTLSASSRRVADERREADTRVATIENSPELVQAIYGFEGTIGFTGNPFGLDVVGITRDKQMVPKIPYRVLENNYFFSAWALTNANKGKFGSHSATIGAAMTSVMKDYSKGAATPFRALHELQKFSLDLHPNRYTYTTEEKVWTLQFLKRIFQLEGKRLPMMSPRNMNIADFSVSSRKAHPGYLARMQHFYRTFSDAFESERKEAEIVFNQLLHEDSLKLTNHTWLALPVVKKSASRKADLQTRCRLAVIPEAYHRILYRAIFYRLRRHIELRLIPSSDWTSKFSLFYDNEHGRVNSITQIVSRFKRILESDLNHQMGGLDTSDHGASIGPHVFEMMRMFFSSIFSFGDVADLTPFFTRLLDESLHSKIGVFTQDEEGPSLVFVRKHWGICDGQMETSTFGTIASVITIAHLLWVHYRAKPPAFPVILSQLTLEIHSDNVTWAACGELANLLTESNPSFKREMENFGYAVKPEEFIVTSEIKNLEIMSWHPFEVSKHEYVGWRSVIAPMKSLFYCEKMIHEFAPTVSDLKYMAEMVTCLYILHYWNDCSRILLEYFWTELHTIAQTTLTTEENERLSNVILFNLDELRMYLEVRGMEPLSLSVPMSWDNSVPYDPDVIKEMWLGRNWRTKLASRLPSPLESDRPFSTVRDLPSNTLSDLLLSGFLSEEIFIPSVPNPAFMSFVISSPYPPMDFESYRSFFRNHSPHIFLKNLSIPRASPVLDVFGGILHLSLLSPTTPKIYRRFQYAVMGLGLSLFTLMPFYTNFIGSLLPHAKLPVFVPYFVKYGIPKTAVASAAFAFTSAFIEESVKHLPLIGPIFSLGITNVETNLDDSSGLNLFIRLFKICFHSHTARLSFWRGFAFHFVWNFCSAFTAGETLFEV